MSLFTGLIAAAFTPFHADGLLKLETVEQQAALFVESGLSATFICGTTGEAYSLTVNERKQLAERWIAVAGAQLPVMIHVGHNCQADAIELARHARRIGAVAIGAMAPFYYKPASLDDLIDFLEPIANAAPEIPFFFYDIPSWTGVRVQTDQLLTRGAERIPTLRGAKFTNEDLVTLQSCLQINDGAFDILFGRDELLLAALVFGARGAIGSTYNYAAPVYLRVIEAFEKGDLPAARYEQHRAVEMVRVLERYGALRAGKVIMSLLGVDCGPVRPPLRSLDPATSRELYDRLYHLDVFSRPLQAGT